MKQKLMVIVFCASCAVGSFVGECAGDPAIDETFDLKSVAGVPFGQKLTNDLQILVLEKSLGVIDKILLRSLGSKDCRFVDAYAEKSLRPISCAEANKKVDEVADALLDNEGVTLYKIPPMGGRMGYCKAIFSSNSCITISWDDHFFRGQKTLKLNISSSRAQRLYAAPESDLVINGLLGYKLGESVKPGCEPLEPFWKFNKVVQECSRNRLTSGIYGVYNCKGESNDQMLKEIEDLKTQVEKKYGIKLFKRMDSDEEISYCYASKKSLVRVKLDFITKEIRLSVNSLNRL